MIFKKIFCFSFLFYLSSSLLAQAPWANPIEKQGWLGSPLVETSPFVFNDDRLYLLENQQRFWDVPGAKPGEYFHDDEVRIRDVASDKIISVPLKNHGFGTVVTWEGRVYVFAGNYGQGKPWRQITEITMTSSADLKNWTEPQTVLRASGSELFYNTAVCRGKDKFILLYETNDTRWTPFTFRYMESTDLINWKEIPDAIYGTEKYVGGPALYYEAGWYYTLYLELLKGTRFETRITRSRNLKQWEDAPEDRPFITFDTTHKNLPFTDPAISEINASDVELCYFNVETILYFTGGDQHVAGDLQRATYLGTPRHLFEYFFKDTEKQTSVSPLLQDDKSGGWEHPLTKMGRLQSPLVEVEPFQLNDEFYLLENWRSNWDSTRNKEIWIAQLPNGPEDYHGRKYISAALTNNSLGTAIVWKDRVYVFGLNADSENQYVEMTWSEDLKTWSTPVKVLDSPAGKIYNISLIRDDQGFVFLWETSGVGRPFTMCFGRLNSLMDNWNDHIIENACYGKEKYTGGPAVFYEDGWYYLLYLEEVKNGWETRITRSLDLINWKDAPENRPFITFNKDQRDLPFQSPDVHEKNASDPSLIHYNGQVIVYYTGGNQTVAGDLQWATFNGTIQQLMERFYVQTETPSAE